MKKQITKFVILMFILVAVPINIIHAQDLSDRLSGKILLQVEGVGQAWYIDPETKERAFLGRPADAFRIMRELGLGISEKDYNSFNGYAPSRLSGKILLRAEANGEAYYVFPDDLKIYYLGRPADAFDVMREKGLGITDEDLNKVPVFQKYKEKIEILEKKVEELAEKIEELQEETAQEEQGESNDTVTSTSPTIPTPPASTSDAYFFEDFDQGDSWTLDPELYDHRWAVVFPEDGTNGMLTKVDDATYAYTSFGDQTWTDYKLRLKIKLEQGFVEINTRMSGEEGNYAISIFENQLILDKDVKPRVRFEDKDYSFNPDQFYDIRVELKGNNIKIYVDEELQIDYVDTGDPVLEGHLGLYISDKAYIDYVIVEDL